MSELSRNTRALLEQARKAHSVPPALRAEMKSAIAAKASIAAAAKGLSSGLVAKVTAIGVIASIAALGVGLTIAPSGLNAHRITAQQARTESAQITVQKTDSPVRLPIENESKKETRPLKASSTPLVEEQRVTALESPSESLQPSTTDNRQVTTSPRDVPPARAPSTLDEETRILREADQALNRGDVATALTRTTEHAARFANSVLTPERRTIRILALCRSGQMEQARSEHSSAIRGGLPRVLQDRLAKSCAAQ